MPGVMNRAKQSQLQGQEWRRLQITGKACPGEKFTSAKPSNLSFSGFCFQSEILCVNQSLKVARRPEDEHCYDIHKDNMNFNLKRGQSCTNQNTHTILQYNGSLFIMGNFQSFLKIPTFHTYYVLTHMTTKSKHKKIPKYS